MDQWSSASLTSSPPQVALQSSRSAAAGGSHTTNANSKLYRMDSGTSVILDLPEHTNAPTAAAAAGPRKVLFSKYKGVVPQPNGRWGAQIYIKNKRIWLGTFNHEKIAARAYDIAAQRYRGWDTYTNFKPLVSSEKQTLDDDAEINFLRSHTEAEILEMVRNKTYYDELHRSSNDLHDTTLRRGNSHNTKNRAVLFDKVVTCSDVGNLNRLVIPKHQALRHFPSFDGPRGCMLLNFFDDVDDKIWSFRYSYWKSSGSYVLSKGWIRFVREKNLKAGDNISFERSTGPDKQIYINFKRSSIEDVSSGGGRGDSQEWGREAGPVVRLFGVDISRDEKERVISDVHEDY